MMQRILRGEMPVFRIDCVWSFWSAYGAFYFELRWLWKHYHETHGLPRTPWYNAALNNVPF